MHSGLQNLTLIKNKVNEIIKEKQLKINPNIIVVSKTFSLNVVKPILDSGHIHFGENKLQEAEDKWLDVKNNNNNLQLHMVGKLQSNKAKKAVKLFDYIHSLDSLKLANKISQYEKELNKKVKLFIQVNIGNEDQKSGVSLDDLGDFYTFCTQNLSLNIIGLMCLPPIDQNPEKYFINLNQLAKNLSLKDLSMGMSSDYKAALINGSTFLRLGSIILGKRNII